jgi:integrase
LKAAGIPVDVAKDIMGHSSITITADIYSHAESNSLNEAKAKMDKLNRQETRKSLLPVKLCAI